MGVKFKEGSGLKATVIFVFYLFNIYFYNIFVIFVIQGGFESDSPEKKS